MTLYLPILSGFKGERILKLSEMCRKLETEAEKVLPFYASSLSPEEDDDVAAAMQEAPSEPLAEVKTSTLLENLLTYFSCFILHCAHCLSSQWLESFSYIWKSVLLTEYLVRFYAQCMISKNIAKLCSRGLISFFCYNFSSNQ